MSESKVKIGIVGVGGMGASHARNVLALATAELTAICDNNPSRLEAVDTDAARYTDFEAMLDGSALDGVIIATPHIHHPGMSLAAFERGLHVLVEKPIAVQVKNAQRMIDGYHAACREHPDLVFAAMFMQRTWNHWRAIKAVIGRGELGKLLRCTWIITDWFRAQSYYDSGDWRATWRGEGGGVLMNQSPHNIDLYQWMVGMPKRVQGFAHFGKHHRVEVEDEVTAYFEFDNGMVGHFITTTGESPGSNRLEIMGEYGKLVYENGEIIFFRNERSSIEQIAQSPRGFDKVPFTREQIDYEPGSNKGHDLIIANFVDAIQNGSELIAPAVEGINSLMLSNAIILSAHLNEAVELPIDPDVYAALLQEYIEQPPV